MPEAKTSREPASILETVTPGESLLDKVVEEGRLGQTPEERDKGKNWIKELVDQVLRGEILVSKDSDAAIGERL